MKANGSTSHGAAGGTVALCVCGAFCVISLLHFVVLCALSVFFFFFFLTFHSTPFLTLPLHTSLYTPPPSLSLTRTHTHTHIHTHTHTHTQMHTCLHTVSCD